MARKIVIYFLTTLFIVSLASPSLAQELERSKMIQDIFIASSVAYSNFQEFIARQGTELERTELESFMSDIKNYEIVIYSQNAIYIISFVPKMYHGRRLRGGAATYEIDSKTMRILKFTPTK